MKELKFENQMGDLLFDGAIPLKKDHKYFLLRVNTKENSNSKSSISSGNIEVFPFKFFTPEIPLSIGSSNGTSEAYGMFPYLLYSNY